jgi:serine/threonine-protein kinase
VPIEIDRLRRPLADRYTIEREIGRGGTAVVYLAQDLKHGRQVAVKVFQPELASSLGSERFLREIETAARLNHPHSLPLHDSGEADDSESAPLRSVSQGVTGPPDSMARTTFWAGVNPLEGGRSLP